MLLIDEILRNLQIMHPTPLKRAWLLLTLLSVLLKLIAVVRVPMWGFKFYLVVASFAAVWQNTDSWGLKSEIVLAASMAVFTFEIVFFSPFGVPHAWARHYDRQVAMIFGMTLLIILLFYPPPPYPGYPKAMYYTHLYSTAVALALIVGSEIQAWDMRANMPIFLRWHGLLAIPWLSVAVWAGTVRGRDWAVVGVTAVAVQIACLIGWFIVTAYYGSQRAEGLRYSNDRLTA